MAFVLYMHKKLVLIILLWLFGSSVQAQPRPDSPSLDHDTRPHQEKPQAPEAIAAPVGSPASPTRSTPSEISLHELSQQPERFIQVINHTIYTRNWPLLARLVPVYENTAGHDPLLVLYAKGILYRQNSQHNKAIAAYRALLSSDPDLLYVRFDLAIMLYENREYEAAMDQFQKALAGNLRPELQQVAEQYIERIQAQSTWQWYVSAQPERTDNINNAASVDKIPIGNGSYQLAGYEPPRSATGLRYYASADRQHNLHTNHYLSWGLAGYGVEYQHKNRAYNETTLRAQFGYVYQDVKHQFASKPFIERVWFGGQAYQRGYGLTNNYRYWLHRHIQLTTDLNYNRKIYQADWYKTYDAHHYFASLGINYFYSPTLIFLGGIDYSREKASADPNSYRRYGVRAGAIKEFEGGLSARLDLRYSYKKHDIKRWPEIRPGTLASVFEKVVSADTPRRDREIRSTLTVWHRNVHFYGFTPKLSYTHHRINSSMPLFYSRRNNNVYLNFEHQF